MRPVFFSARIVNHSRIHYRSFDMRYQKSKMIPKMGLASTAKTMMLIIKHLIKKSNMRSPEDGYIYSFGDDDYSDENEYTYYDSCDEEDIYFIYNYARTNDEEDRAVTGEYLYNAYKGGDDDYMYEDMFALEHIRKKAETLCRFFRENFDCLKQIPEGEWYLEKAL